MAHFETALIRGAGAACWSDDDFLGPMRPQLPPSGQRAPSRHPTWLRSVVSAAIDAYLEAGPEPVLLQRRQARSGGGANDN
jgi:hypothetical protein